MRPGSRRIRRHELDALRRDGAVFLPALLDRTWVRRMSRALDPVERRHARLTREAARTDRDLRRAIFFTLSWRWTHDPAFRALVFDSPLSAAARTLMGARRATGLFMDQVFLQRRRAAPSYWHHARSAVPLTGRQYLNVWIPFDPVPAGRGSLGFVAGSHRWDRFFLPAGHHLRSRRDGRFGERGRYRVDDLPPIDEQPQRYPVITWDFEPGDAVAFGMNVVHRATGAAADTVRRRAITTRWWGDDIRFDRRPRSLGPILRTGLRTGDRIDDVPLFPAVWRRTARGRWRRQRADRYDPSSLLDGPVYHDERE